MRASALAFSLLAALAAEALAQSPARPLPPGARPLEDPPPMPAQGGPEAALRPQVTVRTTEAGDRVEEHRIGGKLYMQRVKPRNGPAYVLVDHKGDGTFTRQDNTLDAGLRVPQWVLLEF
jgi:hypothetical protein